MNRIVGPLLKIIGRMGRDIANFLVILTLTIFTFCCVGMIIFDNLPQFSTFNNALLTLFSWTLGSFSMDEMVSEGIIG